MDNENYKRYESFIEPWKITGLLGEGGCGKVFEISREEFGNTYKAALKAITIPQTKSEIDSVMADGMDQASVSEYYKGFVSEITKECALMSKFKGNSNIVSYEDHKVIEHTDGIGWDIFIRMELLTPMLQHEQMHNFSEKDIIKLGIDICKALELCRKNNVIHRDIKPENIFVSDDDNYKLGDFGIARTIEKTTGGLSKTGTSSYMAPEVYKGEDYGFTVDIYSLGMVMYRCLNNRRTPFLPPLPQPIAHYDREDATRRRIKGEPLPRPCNGSDELAGIVLKACSYNSADRFQTPTEMKEALIKLAKSTTADYDTELTMNMNEITPPSVSGVSPENRIEPDFGVTDNKAVSVNPEQKKKSKKWLKFVILAIIIAALAVAGIMFVPKLNLFGRNSAAIQNGLTFELIPKEKIKDSQVKEAAEIIEDRVKCLGDNYSISVDGQKIKLTLGQEILGASASENEYMVELLCVQGTFNVLINGVYSEFEKDGIESITLKSDTKENLIDYYGEQLEGTDYNGFSAALENLEDDAEMYYLQLELDSDAAEDFGECIDALNDSEYTKNMNAVFDMEIIEDSVIVEYFDFARVVIDSKQSDSEFCIMNVCPDERTAELVKHIFESEELPSNFSWKLKDTVQFEAGDDVTGEYQKESVDGNVMELQYTLYENSEYYKDEKKYQEAVQRIKDRLDVLEEPYAIGYRGMDGKTAVVHISPEAIGRDFIRMLGGSDSIALYSQSSSVAYGEGVKISKNSSGKTCLVAIFDDYYQADLQTVAPGENIYLVVNDVTVSAAVMPETLTVENEKIELEFSNLIFIDRNSIEKEDLIVADFIATCADSADIYASFTTEEATYVDEKGNEIDDDIPWGYDCETELDKEIIAWIEKTCPEAEAGLSSTSRNTLLVELDLKLDSDMPEKFMSIVKDIYTQCNLGDGSYQGVRFYIKDESERDNEDRCRVGFSKDMWSSSTSVEMYMYHYISGSTFSKYSEEFKGIINTDPFFVEFADKSFQ